MILPDYDNSILSIVSSMLKSCGCASIYPSVPELDAMLNPAPKNIVFLLLDGLGQKAVRQHLPEDGFLRSHTLRTVTAVFPSTTAASTTAYYAASSPNEHGWLGWSLYFKECAQQLDVFQGNNSYTRTRYAPVSPAYTYMPFETIFQKVRAAAGDSIRTVSLMPFPSECDEGAHVRRTYRDHQFAPLLDELYGAVRSGKGRQLIYGYFTNPDHEEHVSGPDSEATHAEFNRIDEALSAFAKRLEGTDTVLILSADHGLRGPMKPAFINGMPELMECLIMPPFIEGRAASFFIKPHRKAQFKRAFAERFSDTFVLYTRQQVLDMQLFGRGQSHPKVDDFLGDYLACAVGDEYIDFAPLGQPEATKFIGAHAGLTEEEMIVPVIGTRL